MGALKIAETRKYTEKSKHIAIKYFYVCDLQEGGVIAGNWFASANNVSDMMTKSLGPHIFAPHRTRSLGGEQLESPAVRNLTVVTDEFA